MNLNYDYFTSPIGDLIIVDDGDFLLRLFPGCKEDFTITESLVSREVKSQLKAYFLGDLTSFNIPIKLEGTDFQKSVWQNLVKIPYGQTLSYKELASLVGNEKAYRAVGNANSKNKILIIIPCHRVLAKNSLGGFAAGIKNKKYLLSLEGVQYE